MTLQPTFLLYRTGFAPTNGTSVQMERLFRGQDDAVVHLMWFVKEGGPNSLRWVVRVDDGFHWRRPFGPLGGYLCRLRGLVRPNWWNGHDLDAPRLRAALARIPVRPRQAYVICYAEHQAAEAGAIWDVLGNPPFVLHVMDLFHSSLSRESMPQFARLAQAADHVFCLNKLIESEILKVGAQSTSVFPLCSGLSTAPRRFLEGPLKILISGALYAKWRKDNIAMQLLVEAWPRLKRLFPKVELHYSGAFSRGLPWQLRPDIVNHRLLPAKDYEELLRACHVAYVPVSHLQNTPLRFSIPSRIPDYLTSGLPVVACTEKETGIYEFFQTTPAECTQLVQTPDEFIAALTKFAGDQPRWEKASRAASDFARGAFALDALRDALFEKLNAAGAR